MRRKAVWNSSINGCKKILREKSWGNLQVADCVFLYVCSPLALSLKCPQKPGLPFHQIASFGPGYKIKRQWKKRKKSERNQILHYSLFQHSLLTCDWPGLRGGDKSPSESLPLGGRTLGGDWSESEPRLVFEGLLGGDWSESEAFPFRGLFLGGDGSESESCLFWPFLATADRWGSGERFLLNKDELSLLLLEAESDKDTVNLLIFIL